MLELLSPWPRATVLEIGGGHGQLAGPLSAAGYDLTVHGSVTEACSDGIRALATKGRLRFEAAPLSSLPWPDRSFDAVIAVRLLPHADDWRRLVWDLCRLARHAVIVDYPTKRSVNAVGSALFDAKKGIEGNTRPFRVFTERETDEAFAACSFRSTARRPEFALPMALHRALGLPGFSRTAEGLARAIGATALLGSPVVRRAERRE